MASVTFGSKLHTIYGAAFYGCTSLTELYIPANAVTIADAIYVDYDYRGVFEGCTSLVKVTIGDDFDDIFAETLIGSEAFHYCTALKEIVLGEQIAVIASGAFVNCPELTTVNYYGTEAKWNEIDINENNTTILNATLNYNFEG